MTVFVRYPTEPQCSYDPIEGLKLKSETDSVERIQQLENEVCESFNNGSSPAHVLAVQLKSQLFEKEQAPWHSTTPNHHQAKPGKLSPTSQTFSGPSVLMRPINSASGISLPQALLTMVNSITPDSPLQQIHRSSGLHTTLKSGSNPLTSLLFSGWDPDLPDPNTLNH